MGKLKSLKELQSKGKSKGVITAGLSSQIADGAAAVRDVLCMTVISANGCCIR